MVKHKLEVTNYDLWVMSYKFRVKSLKEQVI